MYNWNSILDRSGWRPATIQEVRKIGEQLCSTFSSIPMVIRRTPMEKRKGVPTRGLLALRPLRQGREEPGEAPYFTNGEVLGVQRWLSKQGWKPYCGVEEERLENYFSAETKWHSFPGQGFFPLFYVG